MTPLQAVAGFAVAAGLLTITPGLDSALVLRTAAVEGSRRGMLAGFGICAGLFVWGAAASLGLSALLALSHTAYDILRIAGAGYVIWLGARLLLAAWRDEAGRAAPGPAPSGRSWLLRGFLTNILNPKVGVFYVTFLPLFIPAGEPVALFAVVLTAIHVIETLLWFWLLTLAVRPMARFIGRGARILDGITGGALLAFGAGLLLERR
ncbi:MAG: LysE family translocator [Proteobacteria bacterium]|nr:LysE family translocator [Pseudomonadota bacterium]